MSLSNPKKAGSLTTERMNQIIKGAKMAKRTIFRYHTPLSKFSVLPKHKQRRYLEVLPLTLAQASSISIHLLVESLAPTGSYS